MSTQTIIYNPFTNNLDFVEKNNTPPSPSPYPGGVAQWIDVTVADYTMAPNMGYTANNNSVAINLTLPAHAITVQ